MAETRTRTRERTARNVPLITAIVATVVAVVLAYVHERVAPLPGLGKLEGITIDARFKLRGPRAPGVDRIVVIGLDDETHERAPDVFQTRRGYARLFDAIARYEPKLVAVDLLFSSPEVILPDALAERVRVEAARLAPLTDPAIAPTRTLVQDVAEELRGDEMLARAIARNGRVLLGSLFFQGPRVVDVPEPAGMKSARHGEVADAGGGGPLRPLVANVVRVTLPGIAQGAVGMGGLNTLRDGDGVTRSMPLVLEHGGRHYMSLGLAAALVELGRPGDTRYVAGARTIRVAGRDIPLTDGAALQLDILGQRKIPHVSAAKILDGTAPREALAGKIAFLGFTYATSDKVITPLDLVADGVELHATLAENLLAGNILRRWGWLGTVLVTLVLAGIVCVAQLRRVRRRTWIPPVIALLAIAGWVAIAFALFSGGTVVAMSPPVVLAGSVLVAATIGSLATEGREKAHLRAVFSQYVSRPVVDRILANPDRAKLGGERKELTVLFSDIRGFSNFSEGMAPEALAKLLGEYLTPMTELVMASGGTLDKYIGDAIMAVWGAPVDMADHAARCCEVALRMQERLGELNRAWAVTGRPPIAIGVGINTGPMAVGNMGSEARFEYTVIGDQVNLASRLEGLTKEYGVGILVGESTAAAAGDGFIFREVDLVRVKGRAGAAPVFELVGRAGRADPTFGRALALYRSRDFAAAREIFGSLDHDPAAAVMAARCAELAENPPPADWDGVYEQRGK